MSESAILRAVAHRIKQGFTYNSEYDEADVMAELETLATSIQSKGGKARAAAMTDDQRSQSAKKAARQRWRGHKKAKPKSS